MTADPVDIDGLFPPADGAAWRTLVEAALKGRPFESLSTRTEEGIVLAPLYGPAEGVPSGRPRPGPWLVNARVDHPDPAEAAAFALEDLENGATGLSVVLPGAPTAWGAGVAAFDLDALDRALSGILLDLVPIRLEGGGAGRGLLALVLALVERRGLDPAAVELHAGLDPLGAFAATGKLSAPFSEVARRLADTAAAVAATGCRGTIAAADGRPFHAAGATDAAELGLTLAAALSALRAFDDAGQDPGEAARRIGFSLAVDQDQFGAIAKVRALRRLWAAIRRDCALPDEPAHVHAETAFRMLSARDAHTNLLRTTIAAFSAGTAGADAVTVLPFSQAVGVPDAFARRIARNTGTILIEESHLAAVTDPAAGSGAVEARTEALAATAFDVFRDIERAGGLAEAIASGKVHERVTAERAARGEAVARLKRPIVGTSRYANLEERTAAVADARPATRPAPTGKAPAPAAEGAGAAFRSLLAAASAGANLADFARAAAGTAVAAPPLGTTRLSEPYEALRAAADAAHAAGVDTRIVLVTLGPLARHTPRADFAANALAAGGIRTARSAPLDDPAAAAEAFRASGAAIACLCGDDAAYAATAVAMAEALAAAGARAIYLAGRPGEAEAALTAAGVNRFLFAGMDAVETLAAVHADIGIPSAAG